MPNALTIGLKLFELRAIAKKIKAKNIKEMEVKAVTELVGIVVREEYTSLSRNGMVQKADNKNERSPCFIRNDASFFAGFFT